MKLSSIRIRHYKSLSDAYIKLDQRVTLLVGQNAAGKSNVVDCLRFLRDAVESDLEHAVSARGGIPRIRQYSRTKPYKMGIHLVFDEELLDSNDLQATYDLSIESLTSSNYAVDNELIQHHEVARESKKPRLISVKRDRLGNVVGAEDDDKLRLAKDQLAFGNSRVAMFGGWTLQRFVRDWRFSAIYPNRLRDPSTPDRDNVLSEDGRNWASVIKALRRTPRGRAALERIFESMRSVIPSFQEVTVSSVGSYLVPQFRFHTKGSDSVVFDPVQLSDGTLRVFGILLALYQVPAPKLLVIEEPEQTVHPGVLGVLADAFMEASESTQIVVTTHSPHLVDYFEPQQVRVVSLDSGVTTVNMIRKSQVEAVKRRLMTLQEFMYSEGLMPETS